MITAIKSERSKEGQAQQPTQSKAVQCEAADTARLTCKYVVTQDDFGGSAQLSLKSRHVSAVALLLRPLPGLVHLLLPNRAFQLQDHPKHEFIHINQVRRVWGDVLHPTAALLLRRRASPRNWMRWCHRLPQTVFCASKAANCCGTPAPPPWLASPSRRQRPNRKWCHQLARKQFIYFI